MRAASPCVLRVDAIHADLPFDEATSAAVHAEIQSLAQWLELHLSLPRQVPPTGVDDAPPSPCPPRRRAGPDSRWPLSRSPGPGR